MNAHALGKALKRLDEEVERHHLETMRALTKAKRPLRQFYLEQVDREPSVRPLIDKACRHWINSGAWPDDLGGDLFAFAFYRIVEAQWFAGEHKEHPAFSENSDERQILESLLVHHWSFAGVERWKSNIDAMPI